MLQGCRLDLAAEDHPDHVDDPGSGQVEPQDSDQAPQRLVEGTVVLPAQRVLHETRRYAAGPQQHGDHRRQQQRGGADREHPLSPAPHTSPPERQRDQRHQLGQHGKRGGAAGRGFPSHREQPDAGDDQGGAEYIGVPHAGALDDQKRIPDVRESLQAVTATPRQRQQQHAAGQVHRGKPQLVGKQGPGQGRGGGEHPQRQRRIDRGDVAMRGLRPEVVTQPGEALVVRRQEIRVRSRGGDPSVPQVAVDIVGEARRER